MLGVVRGAGGLGFRIQAHHARVRCCERGSPAPGRTEAFAGTHRKHLSAGGKPGTRPRRASL